MKIKTADLIGPALDWAVAKAQGREGIKIFGRSRPNDRGWVEVRFNPDPRAATARFDPSESWSQGGPIIERECMDILCLAGGDDGWQADKYLHTEQVIRFGPTPLIAACRCLVASKLGDEVDIPEELL